jgi:hypothetical protein
MSIWNLFHKRIHESLALAAQFSVAVTLQIAWISNLLVHRSEWAREQATLIASIGPISGLYLESAVLYVLLFGIFVLSFRGRDCSHWRDRAFWFFLISIAMFLVLTLPIVYEFSITVRDF